MHSFEKSTRLVLIFAAAVLALSAQVPAGRVSLPGHVLGVLPQAIRLPGTVESGSKPVSVAVMLKLTDQAGADAFLETLNDPNSANYHQIMSGPDFTARFGPTQEAYDAIKAHFEQAGLTLVQGSTNRRMLTFHGARAQAEAALDVQINDYQLGTKTFHATNTDPALPANLAPLVAGVSGLSNLGQWQSAAVPAPTPATTASIMSAYGGKLTPAGSTNSGGLPPGLDGTGQTIGLISFSNYDSTAISEFLTNAALPSSLLSHVSNYEVAGGTPLSGDTETLLDIDSALGAATGAKIVVYIAPYLSGEDAGDFYTPIAAAIDNMWPTGGAISTSYYTCESTIAASDAANLDSLVASASAVGITLFAATGDDGTTCFSTKGLEANTVVYPADLPHVVAVGGTSLSVKSGNVYDSEQFWANAKGSGGYGISALFGEPSYQSSLYPSAGGRSVPDVAMDADPDSGIAVCLGSGKPCPTVGGTSMASPLWAAIWTLAGQANKDALGYTWTASGSYLYHVSDGFNSSASIVGGDFADVGLGTPIIPTLIAKGITPTIDSFSPVTGPAAGGTTVTIIGTGFIGVEKVTFGGAAGTHLTIESDSKLTVESPVAPGLVTTIELVTPGGTAKASSFTYVPEIDSVSPNMGALDGGVTVTVTGRALDKSLAFAFGGAVASSVSCSNATSCTMVSPAHSAGTVDVVAETPWGYGDSPLNPPHDQFTYSGPAITSLSPAVGPTVGGGTFITVTGFGFQNGKTTISFGGVAGTGVYCFDSTSCNVTIPAQAAGAVQVTATVAGVASAPASQLFTYVVFPTITGILPAGGKTGDVVTITGTGFSTVSGQTSFLFAGVPVAGTCTSTTQCTAVVPAQVQQQVAVYASVNGNVSLNWVTFTYSTIMPIQKCHPGTCL